MNSPSLVVFSDLDGTLLDHETYDWQAARPALRRLESIGAPVILSSSKTAAEIRILQEAMGLSGLPAIVENGAGLIGPGREDAGADDYDRLRRALAALPRDLTQGFCGFGDMTDAQVADATGLATGDAQRARQRQFSEPGIWRESDAARDVFLTALAARGVHARSGGRFLTLSFGRTKADGMRGLIELLKPQATIALGDAPNDVEMLEAADHGVVVANPHRPALPTLRGEAEGRITRTVAPGPEGWNDAVHALLDFLKIN